MNFQLYDLKTLKSIPMTISTNHLFFKNVAVLLVLYEARTENSATRIPRSMAEQNLRDLISLLHGPPGERQGHEEIAKHVVWN